MPHPEHLVSDDVVIVTQRTQHRCGCGALFEASMPIQCSMDMSIGAMLSLRCPTCGTKDKIYVGQDRTLAEDRSFDWGYTFEERVSAWAKNGEFGESSRAIFRRMLGGVPGTSSPGPDFHGSRAPGAT